jgi:catechol 2,3-dioxygenase-like lactoylglutathione lyase family enzyme
LADVVVGALVDMQASVLTAPTKPNVNRMPGRNMRWEIPSKRRGWGLISLGEARRVGSNDPAMTPRLDHLALPCFDLDATHGFCLDLLGAPLVHAQSGDTWLLAAYEFAGVMLDYFVVPGEKRPPSRGRDETRHHGIAVGSVKDLERWKERIANSGAETWTEDHGSDEHVYFYDPNGNLFELTADAWTVRAKGADPVAAGAVIDAWRARKRSAR